MTDLQWKSRGPLVSTPDAQRIRLVQQALDAAPRSAPLHVQLGALHASAGTHREALAAYTTALELDPELDEAMLGVAQANAECGQLEEAIGRFQLIVGRRPASVVAHLGLGRALARSGREPDAIESFRAVLSIEPANYNAMHHLVRILIQRGALDEALDVCDQSEARRRGNTTALAMRSQVLIALGRVTDAAALLDYESLLTIASPSRIEGFETVAAFNDALAESIRRNKGLVYEPRGTATRGGVQTMLRADTANPEAILHRIVQAEMARYRERVLSRTTHPFREAAPDRAALDMWTVLLRRGGHQDEHIHPSAWLSAVYYVKVPEPSADGAGSLILGCADRTLGMKVEPLARTIVPTAGLLILFPGFYYHRTVPTQTDDERICVAFNMNVEQ